jgi:2'-5' RNA ligase
LKSPRHRLFFALRPEPDTLQGIVSIQQLLASGRGRPVPRERLHATLLFLGNQEHDEFQQIQETATELEFPICGFTLDRVGHFPRAAVVWLGSNSIPQALQSFQHRLSQALEAAGLVFERRDWRLHVTLYRDLRKRPAKIDFKPVKWSPRRFCLMESVQTREGLLYIERGSWPARIQVN